MKTCFALIALSAFVLCALATRPNPIKLPGAPAVQFQQYSGYQTVNTTSNRNLFYYFSESQNDPANDPVVIWLTGGPGCSSLIAMLSEQGPYRPDPKTPGQLTMNPYSWNKIANVIWLESPAGVGFSFSDNPADMNVGDVRTAQDAWQFLQLFFTDFPEFASNQFWITGESYGGHYTVELAQKIFLENQNNPKVKINIRGLQVGNAWTYSKFDNAGALDTWSTRGFVSKRATDAVKANCDLTNTGPLRKRDVSCNAAINTAMSQMGNINIYDAYTNVCTDPSPVARQLAKYNPILKAIVKDAPPSKDVDNSAGLDVCIDAHLTAYLNRAEVQSALGARPGKWEECSSIVNYNYKDIMTSVIPVYQFLFKQPNFDILVYSGNVDLIVPFTGTMYWIDSLSLPVEEEWRPWYPKDDPNQVGGYVTKYNSMTFTTVRGAGHQCPTYQNLRTYHMFSSFLTGQRM